MLLYSIREKCSRTGDQPTDVCPLHVWPKMETPSAVGAMPPSAPPPLPPEEEDGPEPGLCEPWPAHPNPGPVAPTAAARACAKNKRGGKAK